VTITSSQTGGFTSAPFLLRRRSRFVQSAIKGKSSIWIAQNVERKARNFAGHKFWARGYFVSSVGCDEETIRAYIKNQELQDREMDQLALIP